MVWKVVRKWSPFPFPFPCRLLLAFVLLLLSSRLVSGRCHVHVSCIVLSCPALGRVGGEGGVFYCLDKITVVSQERRSMGENPDWKRDIRNRYKKQDKTDQTINTRQSNATQDNTWHKNTRLCPCLVLCWVVSYSCLPVDVPWCSLFLPVPMHQLRFERCILVSLSVLFPLLMSCFFLVIIGSPPLH